MSSPTLMYVRLNRLLWMNRLPHAKIVLVEDSFIPECRAITIHDDLVVKPVIAINNQYRRWAKTLLHEMLHVAEPRLQHGELFDALVEFHWMVAKTKIKGLGKL